MKNRSQQFRTVLALAIQIAMVQLASAAPFNFAGPSGADWLLPASWSPAGPPGANDEARFFNPGAVADATIDAIVSSNLTIQRLWIGQTNNIHNIGINAGVTLTISGTDDNGWGPLGSDPNEAAPDPLRFLSTLYVGTKTTNSSTQIVKGTFSGAGTLFVNNPNNEILIRQFHPTGAAHRAILDLSGLDNFVANLGRIRVGDGEAQPINRSEGQLFLGKTNTITLSGTNYQDNVQLVVGNNDVNQNQSNPSVMVLGGKNILNADEILVGGKKQPGTLRSTNTFANATLTLRGSDGVGRVRALRIGDASDQPSSGNGTTGIANFSDDTVNILADAIVLGKSQSSGTGNGSLSLANLILGPGTVDVNTLDMAFRMDNNSYINAATGNLSLSNTAVTVNSLLRMGRLGGFTVPPVATITMNGGSLTVRSNLTIEGVASITNVNGAISFTRPSTLVVKDLVLDGGSLSNNAGTIIATNSFTILNSGSVLGNPAFDMGNNGSASWNVQGAPGGGLTVSNSFQGGGNLNGNLIQASGASIGAGGNGTVGSLSIIGNLTLNAGTLNFDLSSTAGSGNDQISVAGNVLMNATNDVLLNAVSGAFDTTTPYLLMSATSLSGNQNDFRVAGPLAQSRYTFAFDTTSTPNTLKLLVGGSGGTSLTWVGDGTVNVWDTTALNWNGPNKFFSLDNVTFNDSGSATPAISMSGTLIPGSMTFNNPTKNYTFGGAGGLAASGSLNKSGAATLTFNNNAGNSFSSIVNVSNGPVTFSNNGRNSFNGGVNVYGGSLTLSGNTTNIIGNQPLSAPTTIAAGASLFINNANANMFGGAPIQLDGTLSFNQPADATLAGDISGVGTLIKSGSGRLTISGNNAAFNTIVQINGGTVAAGSVTALGAAGAIVTNNATLDLAGRNLGTLTVTASGSGAGGNGGVVSTGAPLLTGTAGIGLGGLTMAGNLTVGGSGPWDTDPVKNLGVWGINSAALSTSGNAYSLTKVGQNQFGLSSATVDPALSNIDVQQGLLALQGSTDTLGNPANSITVRAGASVSFYDTGTAWDKKFILFGDGVTPNLFNYNGANVVAGQVTLNGNCVFGAAPFSRGTPVSLSMNGPIGGTGSLTKSGQDTLILNGTNNYAGSTVVKAGRLVLDGNNNGGGLLTNAAGTTLAGLGTNTGPVAVNGTLSPGDDVTITGTIRTGPLSLNSATLIFDVDSSASDRVEVSGNLSLSGTIGVQINPGSALTVGQNVTLIHYTGSLIGGTNGLQLLPLPPGFAANLFSNINVIGITVTYVPVNKTWRGVTAAGPTLWDIVTTNWDNSGTPDRYNSGDFAIFDDSGLTNRVTLVGTLTPASIDFNGAASYALGGAGKLSGTPRLTLSSSGSLTITNTGSNDFTGPITLNPGAGSLFVGNGGASGNLGSGVITNSTAITFNRSGTNTVNNNFYDIGVVTNMGTGVLVLGGDNSQADMNLTAVTGSTVRPASSTALGRNVGTTLIQNGATLDVNGQNLGPKSVTVSGTGVGSNGAIVNSGAAQISALQALILQDNTTFGGSARWDLRAGTVSSLDTGGQPYSITKKGTNQVSFVSITNIDAALADIDIQQGIFSVQNNTGQLGDPTRTITVRTNAALDLFALNLFPLNKNISVQSGGTITNESGVSVIAGPVSLSGKATFGIAGTSLIISNTSAFTGTGVTNLLKTGAGSLILVGNSVPSSTLLDLALGTLDLSQATSSTLNLAAGQTLRGNGTLNGALSTAGTSTVSPGESVGVLTVKGNISLGGTNLMEVDRTAGTNDLLVTSSTSPTTITYGGTLRIVTLTGTIAAGNTFKLFSASNYSGMFAALSPATPGVGLAWNTNTLAADGILRVISTVNTNRANIGMSVSGNQLTLSWPSDHVGWRLQVQTNTLAVGIRSNWVDVAGSTTVSNVTVTINPANGSVFYRMIYP